MRDILEKYLMEIEKGLQEALSNSNERLAAFYGMMRYHLGWANERLESTEAVRGKRLRPSLCLLTCEVAGGDWHLALPAAAAIELAHNFSLIHDDIEDKSPFRHHRPTVWKIWGEPQSINVGDGMFILAHLALHRLLDRGVAPGKASAITRALNEACLALTQGQYLDLSFEDRLDVTVEEYLAMIKCKTAALIACATEVGAMLATDDETLIEHYRSFGEYLGLGFQVVDDILGIWGDPQVTGKPVADDIVHKKKTLPIVYALGQGLGVRGKALRGIYCQEALDEKDAQMVLGILDALDARGYAQGMAKHYRDLALAELERTGIENEAQAKLKELAVLLTERTY